MLSRRNLITGLVSFVAAPAIVRVGSLMPIKVMVIDPNDFQFIALEWSDELQDLRRSLSCVDYIDFPKVTRDLLTRAGYGRLLVSDDTTRLP